MPIRSSSSRRPIVDRLSKYIVDPRRMTHNYILQVTLCFMVTGPSFMDSFFNAMTPETIRFLDITHEQFSFLISIPSATGVIAGIAGLVVAMYGSTVSALVSAMFSLFGSAITVYGIVKSMYSTVMLGRIIFSLFWSLLSAFQTVLIFKLYRGTTLAWVFSLQIIAIRIGTAGGFFCSGYFLEGTNTSVPESFILAWLISSFSLLCTVLFAYLYRGTKTAKLVRPLIIGRRSNSITDNNTQGGFNQLITISNCFKQLPTDVYIQSGVIFFYYAGFATFESFGVDFLSTHFEHISRPNAGSLLSSLVLISLLSPIIAPMLSDTKKQLNSQIFGTVVVGVTMAILANRSDTTHPLILIGIIGAAHMFVVGGVWLALASVCRTENEKANAASIGFAVNCLSSCFTSWTTGKLRDLTGNYDLAYTFLACNVFVAAILSVYVRVFGHWTISYFRAIDNAKQLLEDNATDFKPIVEHLMPSPVIDDYFS